MRLVGASNYFIYLPYLFSAFIYSLVSSLIAIAIVYPLLTLLQPYLVAFFNGYSVNVLAYFLDNFYLIFGVQFLGVLVISNLASLLAVHKYTKI
jgi:cell division protein FtsX